jgi:ankyrin repeat protein
LPPKSHFKFICLIFLFSHFIPLFSFPSFPPFQSGRTALFLAAEANRVKCADVLLRYKASTEASNTNNVTPLGVACDQGHTAMILLLI